MLTINEGGTATSLVGGATSVLTNDTDAEGNALTAILVSAPANGTLTLNANGTFSYTHNGGETTTDSFTYKVNDGTVDGNTVTVSINVTPVNDLLVFSGLTDGIVPGTDAQVRESDLASGSTPSGTGETVSGTFTLGPSTALVSLTINGGAIITKAQLLASAATPITVNSARGVLTVNGYNATTGVVNYVYTLSAAANHSGGAVNDSFLVSTTDVEGDLVNANLVIDILDDTPVANADVDEAVNFSGTLFSQAKGNVLTGVGGDDANNADGIADVLGADAASAVVRPRG